MGKDRIYALDAIRFMALLFVVLLHSAGLFYIDQSGVFIVNSQTELIVDVASVGRAGVPLFVVISGYLLLPMKVSSRDFFSRRFTRVLIPFLFWSIVYAVFESFVFSDAGVVQCVKFLLHIPINFVTDHLWYVYMLMGLYLLVPVISPWIEKVGKKEMSFLLIFWLLCSLSPYFYLRFPTILGEASWNQYSSIYYFQGFIGYFVLGAYLKKYGLISFKSSLFIFVLGSLLTIVLMHVGLRLSVEEHVFNTIWNYCSINIALITIGLFSIVYHLTDRMNFFKNLIVIDVSKRSYAIYLAHIIVLRLTSSYILRVTDSALLAIPLIIIVVMVTSYLSCWLMSKLPYANKWLG